MRVVDHHCCILVEPDVGSIAAAVLLAGAHNDSLHDFALLHGPVGRRFFHCGGNDVAEAGLLAQASAQGQNHLQLARAGVIGHCEHRSHLYCHGCFSFRPALLPGVPDDGSWSLGWFYFAASTTCSTVAVSSSWLKVERRTISSSAQRFSLLVGRVSRMRTTSPTRAEFCSSCA